MTGIKVLLTLLVAALHLPGGIEADQLAAVIPMGRADAVCPSLFYLYRMYHAPVIMRDVSAEEACFFGINGL